jgi:hypothetical protein
MSSSSTIEGGLTFLPHPSRWVSSIVNFGGSMFSVGGADTTAVADNIDAGPATAAPTGNLGAEAFGFVFCRIGANASAADHPSDCNRILRFNKRVLWRQGCSR